MAKTIDERILEILACGQLGEVIFCGGRGTRAQCVEPKPLLLLPDANRPILSILHDTPDCIPVYLYLLREHKDAFVGTISSNGSRHKISYLTQSEGILYDKNAEGKKPMNKNDGTLVTSSDGSATFIRLFGNPPPYFVLVDGDKVGIAYEDVVAGLETLLKNPETDIVAFTRNLDKKECKKELRRWAGCKKSKKDHARYARINEEKQLAYEHPIMPKEVITDASWPAITGMYVVRSKPLLEKTRELKGALIQSRSEYGIETGYAYHLKLAMTLRGYNGSAAGLDFLTYNPKWYIKGIKTVEDKKNYLKWKKQGMFDYRTSDWQKQFLNELEEYRRKN